MPQDSNADVASIREWLSKEPRLPKDIDDFMLRKFLHSCYGSLEKTKKCIERFCDTRANMPEVYTSRDPTSAKLKTAFSITAVTTWDAGNNEILIHQLDDPTLEHFSNYDVLKAFSIQADYWLKVHDRFPDGHIIVIDIKDYTLKIIPKVNIMFFRDFLVYLLEGMPVRVKQVHIVNCPSYIDKLFSLVKPALPTEICNIITFHEKPEGLVRSIGKQYLPTEYGGVAGGMKQQHMEWVQTIQEQRSMFNDNLWKSDLKKKSKSSASINSMTGSFKSLCID
ncbi:unnamed protein product [Chilo suppressalis]|uniref:CRAL-TRIO domain-containing protein n=1 Tax=Chilo suppressalis TaxID=168631 RepID=A0ABN8ATZ9_CHISP|nr:unnamed protein product [Chilo suppressalis]